MNQPDHRIIFMGTPEFAVASLDALVNAGFNIIAVITAPDKPSGRGMKLNESAVKTYAMAKGIPVLQPEKLKNPHFLEQLQNLHADVQVVVAFRMLPEAVWNMPRLGTINLHGSLLPQYRGAAPINWAIINGEDETGVTTFRLQHKIDTGNILLQERIPVTEEETAGELHDKMKDTGGKLLVQTIDGILAGSLKEIPQTAGESNASDLKHAPKIFTETCQVNWSLTCKEIYNLIRGLSPHPGALTQLEGKILKVYKGEKEIVATRQMAGDFETDYKTYLKYAAADGYIHITDLQMEGKKRMEVKDFLRGYRFRNK